MAQPALALMSMPLVVAGVEEEAVAILLTGALVEEVVAGQDLLSEPMCISLKVMLSYVH